MTVDQAFVGRTYPPTPPYEVGREKIREFAAAVGASHPAHLDVAEARALGHRDLVAPPTFPIVLSMRAAAQVVLDPDLGLDYSRVVHGAQRFTYSRPVYAGDRLVEVAVGGATFDVAAPATGELAERLVWPGEEVKPQQVLGTVAAADE